MPEFFDPSSKKSVYGYKLRHWQQGEVMQFVTFRLNGSMPSSKIQQWKEELTIWVKLDPKPWTEKVEKEYHTRFTWKLENWLDEGHGECLLGERLNREYLEETLMFYEGKRVRQFTSWESDRAREVTP